MEQAGTEIASIIAGSSSLDEANDKLTTWTTNTQLFEPLGDVLFVTTALADMAGQLMVAGRETQAIQLAANAPSPKPFLDLPWADALEYFKARGLVHDTDFETLLADYAQRSAIARELMLKQVQSEVMRHLTDAIEQGGTFPEFAKQVDVLTDNLGLSRGKPAYLQMVFRTNVQSAYGAGRYKAMRNPAVQNARPFVQYRTVGDARVRDEHAALDGKTYNSADPVWERIAPPNGFNCFPGDVLVQGKFGAAVRALYTGQIVQLATKSGCRLSITPNHPVLTPAGFVAASSLRNGQHVLSYHPSIDRDAVGEVNPQDAPAPIEQVFNAFVVRDGSAATLGVGANDFYGDAQFFDGDVHVVAAKRALLHAAQSKPAHDSSDFVLAPAPARNTPLVRHSAADNLSIATAAADSSAPRPAALPDDSSAIQFERAPLRELSFGSAAQLDATRYKDSVDNRTADLALVSELLDRHASCVALDEIVSVELKWFHGYVYDLESPDRGWLVAAGIFTSNCRCSMVTLSREDAAGLEISSDIPTEYEPTPGFDQPPTATLDLDAGNTGSSGGGGTSSAPAAPAPAAPPAAPPPPAPPAAAPPPLPPPAAAPVVQPQPVAAPEPSPPSPPSPVTAPVAVDEATKAEAQAAATKAIDRQKLADEALAQNPENRIAWRARNRGAANAAVETIAGKDAATEAKSWTDSWSAPDVTATDAMHEYFARKSDEAIADLDTPGTWANAQYAATQSVIEQTAIDRLRAEGKIDADGFITLYRGVRDTQALGFMGQPGGDLTVNSLSSWTESPDIARSFGSPVLETRVHYTRVFVSHAAQGPTWADEQEWIVITRDGKQPVKVRGYGGG